MAIRINSPYRVKCKYIYLNYSVDARVPWLASQTDMLSDDWMTVDYAEQTL